MKIAITFMLFLLTQAALATPGVVVLAGGGSEGDIGVTTDWSYSLYKKLIENGDTTKDGKIKVVVLSLEKPDSNFMVDYLKSMGATSSENLVITSRKEANDPKLVNTLSDADVIFIRGGNQGKAYQLWKDTKLHEQIKNLADRGGAIGGTSSGAMGLSEYSLTGGQDFTAKDVMQNPFATRLNDEVDPKTSGIHNDFLNLVPGVLVDTHCGERGRIGRLLGAQAKAVDDFHDKKIVSVCLEEKTGIAVENGKAKVFGTGTVHFMQETGDTKMVRTKGLPLVYTDIRDDALTEGWSFDLKKSEPDLKHAPQKTLEISPYIYCGEAEDKFQFTGVTTKGASIVSKEHSMNLFIANDSFSDAKLLTRDKKRGALQTFSLKKLYDHPEASIVLLAAESQLESIGDNQIVSSKNKNEKNAEMGSMILDCQHCSHKSLSSYVSNQDNGTKSLHSPGLVNMRIHILSGDSSYDVKTHRTKILNDSLDMNMVTSTDCGRLQQDKFEDLSNFIEGQEKVIEQMKCK